MKSLIALLLDYAEHTGLAVEDDRLFLQNRLLEVLRVDDPADTPLSDKDFLSLDEILSGLLDDAVSRGVIDDGTVSRDLLDTAVMGVFTPRPSLVHAEFLEDYRVSPQNATDRFYRFCGDVNYIRRARIAKDLKWQYQSPYGVLDITINLSKPEKDPRAIALARQMKSSGYPQCMLCVENEGYAGRINFPARQNHRMIPVNLAGDPWYFQYSPYVYYPEHCIVLSRMHEPMVINRDTFVRLLSFVEQFPHYFVGSNADLPIVGGSILTHNHFQGGHYDFPMAKAPIEQTLVFDRFPDVKVGIVKWPMSCLRLSSTVTQSLVELADHILSVWRSYSDEKCRIFAETDGEAHNTVTPIARYRNGHFELDLVLRNNLTTAEYPLGLFHPHNELHHIKKENIGLIEVMGLAVLPARLKGEMAALSDAIMSGRNLYDDEQTKKHSDWANERLSAFVGSKDQAALDAKIREEIGLVFCHVLEDAGVYKQTKEGFDGFLRFVAAAGGRAE